ncbi:MAG: hypothetical protein DRI90_17590 [Deltaproteobacteria bacterium]|nr:MAG: hypothetical protein DRI90_17590 [Deltaproteobacteria bacterium]
MNRRRDEADQSAGGPDEDGQVIEAIDPGAEPSTPHNEARRTILARRARFVTIALAGAGLAVGSPGCKDPEPTVCLSEVEVKTPPDDSALPGPCLTAEVCLEAPLPEDGGAPPTGSAKSDLDGPPDDDARPDAGKPQPQICLSLTGKPPQPCLAPPQDKPQPCLARPPDKPAPTI